MIFSSCNGDDSIGPGVAGCRDSFDFTILFELLVFSIIPSAIFVLLSIWRTISLMKKPVIVDAPLFQVVKLGSIATYVGLQLALVVLVAVRSFSVTDLFIASTVLQFVSALCMVALSFFDHSRSLRPSLLLNGYLFLTLLFDAAETRTFWLASSTKAEVAYTSLFTAAIAVKLVIFALEAKQKTKWVRWDTKEPHSPEETTGIFGLGVYFWLNSLFIDGYRGVLRVNDLYPLDHAMRGQLLYERFQKHITPERLSGHKYGLLKVVARTLRAEIILPALPRLILIGFTFCQPFFISSLTSYLSEDEPTTSTNYGYGFIGASFFIYSGIAISTAIYAYLNDRMLQMGRACLVSAIYTRATEVQAADNEESASITLMSTDIERIRLGFRPIHQIWANVIEVALASWLLYQELGAAFVAPIVVVICCFLSVSYLVRYTGPSQKVWMAAAQRRVGLTATVIANMKNIKISGLAGPVGFFVQKLRLDELSASGKFRGLIVIAATLAYVPLFLSPFITFAFARQSLDATRVFTSLSYLVLLANPLSQLFQNIPKLFAATACLERIQKFLECETREDFRKSVANFRAESIRAMSETAEAISPTSVQNPGITIQGGRFGWRADKMVLTDINISVPRSSLTFVCGPVASGKSTLCKALLGEIPFHEGLISSSIGLSRISYCDQTPFVSNRTIRDNIVGFTPFDSKRYSDIIEATMLEVDLQTLPRGDQTNTGSNGITLSGGQKQRISLARALYLESDLLIFDDVFSGLDADTEEQVFARVFGADGLLRRRGATAILCTHSVRHLPAADHIIALGPDGTIVEQGTFEDLMKNATGYVQSLDIKSSTSETSSTNEGSGHDTKSPVSQSMGASSTANETEVELDKSRQRGDSSVYKRYFKSMGYSVGAAIFACGIAAGFCNNFSTIWLQYWSSDVIADYPQHSYRFYLGIYALLNIGSLMALCALGLFVFYMATTRAGAHLHQDALTTLIKAPLRYFTATDQGVVVNIFSQDINLIDTELPNGLLNTVYSVFVAIGQAAVLVTTSPYLLASYPFIVALLWLIQRFYLRTSRQLRLLDLESKAPLYTHFLDTTKGIVTLRASGFIPEDRSKNIQLLDTSQRPAYLLQMIQNWLAVVLYLVVMVISVILTSLAIKFRSSSGFTGASLVTLMQLGEELTVIVMSMTQLETSIGAITRLKSFNENVTPEDMAEEDIIPAEDWPQRGRIDIKGVSASYSADATDTEKVESSTLALRDVNLSIGAGEKVAICGRTGSGKSSLIALLLKLLDPLPSTSTNISIDSISLHRVHRPTLRQRIIAIPQDPVFLPDGSSFQANLDPHEIAAASDCQSVLESVGLWNLTQELGGLDGSMNPSTLSQGQRQLFSLARAVLRRRVRSKSLGLGGSGSQGGILFLDEVSSSVDQDTERRMQEIIRVEFQYYTIVAVSHRLDMILDFDRVVVMDKGEVVEVGNPRVLSEDGSTRFGELWRAGGN
ncbi:putative ABC multidrug transporter [Xylariales sp. PMI_506]|nr:putative ABC multidrug transporter [Xylariales sp. PMI_506]